MSDSQARIWEEPASIPTYQVGPPEPNPLFFAGRGYQGAKGPIYPYPLIDKLSDVREDKTYKAVYLENEYIKLAVLPEVGGRIFSAVDKTDDYDFFYRQSVIKPALIGMLGAWISGGVEWNVPHHHRPTTFLPVDYCLAENPDGSKTLWLGEIELRQRMKWTIGLTVRPGRSYLEVTVKIFNRTPFAHSMLYFTNAAVHVNPGYQVIFPPDVQYGSQHAKCEFIKWPVTHGVYSGIDYSAGVDVSWWKNHPHWLSIFAFNSQQDFFGGYDHTKQAGVVHFADHNIWPGKKFFTFGNGISSRTWDKILTDSDGPYLELMAGAYSDNQPDYSWIEPGETRLATEYWYPVRALGGIKNATRDAAVNLTIDPAGVATFAFNATSRFEQATVLVKAADRTLFEQRLTIAPDKPFSGQLRLPAGFADDRLRLSLVSSSGSELVAYSPEKPSAGPMPTPVVPPAAPAEIATSEELYLTGLRLEQFHSPALEPYPYYEEALRRDPCDTRANTALAILYSKRGMFADAEARLAVAVERLTQNYTHPKNGEPYYYLGLALRFQGKRAAARDALNKASWSLAWRSAANHVLAQMALEDGDLDAALSFADCAIAHNGLSTQALCLRAVILRKKGQFSAAVAAASQALDVDPLDYWARNERALAQAASGRASDAESDARALESIIREDAQSHLELASDYECCGLWDDCIEVLSRIAGAAGRARPVDPLVHYTLACYWEKKGDAANARLHRGRSKAMPPDYCFPFRLESIGVLESAMKDDPEDARAPYYLGNLLYDVQPQRAVAAWEISRSLDGAFSIVHRNLAFAYSRLDHDYKRAVASLRKAIAANPADPRLYFEMDILLAADQAPHEERLALLEANHEIVSRRDDGLLREIVLHNYLRNYDRAIELVEERHFHIWEGGENSAHDVYVDAHLLRGRASLAAGKHREALADFLAAAEYPDRFEMGEPYDGGRSAEVRFFIGTACEALGEREKALSSFEEAVRKDKKGTYLAYYQGLAYRKLSQDDKADALFEDLVRVGRNVLTGAAAVDFFGKFGERQLESVRESEGHYLVGLGLAGKGDASGARGEFETAVRMNINHLGARTLLASLGG